MLRILELAWMAIAIITGLVTAYLLITKQFSEAIFMLICSSVACVMYFVRRKQRIRYDTLRSKEQDESRYH